MLIDPSRERLRSIRDCLATFVAARREDEVLDETGIQGFALLEVIQAKAETGSLGSQFATPSSESRAMAGPSTSTNPGMMPAPALGDAPFRKWAHKQDRCAPVLSVFFRYP
jgi:hypothetical protein